MNSTIKKLLREALLSEALINVDSDVEWIYDQFFKKDYEEVLLTKHINNDMFKTHEISTSDLKSPIAIEANELNPCKILINVHGSNFYKPKDSLLSISVNKGAINFIKEYGNNSLEVAFKELNDTQANALISEFKSSSIKGSIHHELVHWIDDTMNNRHISKRLNKADKTGIRIKAKGGANINTDKLEIQGIIHNILQLKKLHADIWDSISFNDLIKLSPSLTGLVQNLSRSEFSNWKRGVITRMNREGLLGVMMSRS